MVIVIRSEHGVLKEFFSKTLPKRITVIFRHAHEDLEAIGADAYFDLIFDDENIHTNNFINDTPVFVNAVCCTCAEINHENYIRLNAWNGFMQRPLTELAGSNDTYKQKASAIFDALGWKYIWVDDDYGLVSARVISMIINEAYFALGEGVSTKEEMDIAMKLGTNYPHGPFAWSKEIGLKNIYRLLKKLNVENSRYAIAPKLIEEVLQ